MNKARANDETLAVCAECKLDDICNGERFRLRYGDLADSEKRIAIRIAHIGWHFFDGKRFAEDEDERLARPLAHKVARVILDEIPLIKPGDSEKAIMDAGDIAQGVLDRMGSYDSKWKKAEILPDGTVELIDVG